MKAPSKKIEMKDHLLSRELLLMAFLVLERYSLRIAIALTHRTCPREVEVEL